jgi:hypothetical protein
MTRDVSGQSGRWWGTLASLAAPFFSVLGAVGYCLLTQYPGHIDYMQQRSFERISFFTVACIVAGILCGILDLLTFRNNCRQIVKSILWLCMPACVLVTTFFNHRLLVKSVRPARNICVNNMRRIDATVTEWAQRTGATNGTPITWHDIGFYFRDGVPKCPEGGTYGLRKVGEDVTCSKLDHRIAP